MKTGVLFGLIVLTAFSLWRAYDALRSLPQTDKVSLIWHGISFFLAGVVSGYVYYSLFGLTIVGWKAALWVAIICWYLADLIWNYVNGQEWSYAGDGKGSRLERLLVKTITITEQVLKKVNINITIPLPVALHVLKLTVTVIAVFITK